LEDYAAYYVRCHVEYGRRCTRLHFFSKVFDRSVLADAIAGNTSAITKVTTCYLGFVVVKPLPSTIIGRTCLVTYEGRNYPATRDQKVHLFGIELSVKSLPFQEQDRDVAACATSALWSVFNGTGHLFQHRIPSPAEITNVAAETQRVMSRALPAGAGLTGEQIADTIRAVGLEPGYVKVENIDLLLISAVAYLKAKIPSILLGALVEQKGRKLNAKTLGLHALALAGYSNPNGRLVTYKSTQFLATATTRLYAHDDQLGPFAKLIVDRKAHRSLLSFSSSSRTGIRFEPRILLVPLYHKIRVPLESVLSAVAALDRWVSSKLGLGRAVVWNVELSSNAIFKLEVSKDTGIAEYFRLKTLMSDLPRYMWRVSAYSDDQRLFDLLFDATDLLQGGHVTGGIPYACNVCLLIAALALNEQTSKHLSRSANRARENQVLDMALSWFAESAKFFEPKDRTARRLSAIRRSPAAAN
jgi:hypothetical protein